jgi:hypothetical protein
VPVLITPESELGKELARWDTPKRLGGMKCNGYEPFPKMVYKALKKDTGKVVCMEPEPSPIGFLTDAEYLRACSQAAAITAQCTRIVHDDDQFRQAKNEGWRESPADALEAFEALEQAVARAAAEANHAAQRMTPKAQAERKAREAATDKHIPE